MVARLLAFLIVVVSGAQLAAQDAPLPSAFLGKVSGLKVTAERLGSEWTGPTGLVIDDFNDLSGLSRDEKSAAESLKPQVTPIRVTQTADFTYRKKDNPLHQITVRVFVFDSAKSCLDWWKQKYEFAGADKFYSAVAGVPYRAVDSKELPKRAASIGNIWITSGAAGTGDEHVKIMDEYIAHITASLKRP
jgi:hypothetical protein